MYFEFRPENYDKILDHYSRNGYAVLTEVDPRLARTLRGVITKMTGLTESQIVHACESEDEIAMTPEMRSILARPLVTTDLQEPLREIFGEFVLKLLGPIVHISRDFHPQIKRGTSGVILKGYSGDGLEVQAAYGFHTDFTAGRVMTSPSATVFWVPLNTCDQNGLRLYRRTHQKGLLTKRWLPPTTPGLDRVGERVEMTAKEGQVLIFNFTVFHGTGIGGPRTRISADLRFFPFCGILDNPPYVLRKNPIEWIRRRLEEVDNDTLRAPLLETLAYLGQPINWPVIERYSLLNWARLIECDLHGDEEGSREALAQFANTDLGFDPFDAYYEVYSRLNLTRLPYDAVIPHLSGESRALAENVRAMRANA